MKVIYKGRAEGKTHDLIEEANSKEGYNLIVCFCRSEVERVWLIIKEKGYKLPMPITFNDFINNKYAGINIKNLYIDNIDLCLQTISRSPIGCITLNKVAVGDLDE